MANSSDDSKHAEFLSAGSVPEPRLFGSPPPSRAPADDAPEADVPPPRPMEGDIVAGRYKLLHELGRGAHGTVHLAHDIARAGDRVALKIARQDSPSDDTEHPTDPAEQAAVHVLRWFRHPNWADVLDSGTTSQGYAFQATRLVNGRSLDQFRGPQPIEFVTRFLEDAADVLDAIHRHGIVHYDISPGNFIVEQGSDGLTFVLSDGGLARQGTEFEGGRGTPQFMAPELTVEGTHDYRVDLYSLGLVAFRLATGSDPIEGGAGEVLGERRRSKAPSPRQRRGDLPKDLDALISSLLEREPSARPANARTLSRQLETLRGHETRTHETTIAHQAQNGVLIARDDELGRFDQALFRLHPKGRNGKADPRKKRKVTPNGARPEHLDTPSDTRPDVVMLVHGDGGAGATRLVDGFHERCRAQRIATLTVFGRHASAMDASMVDHIMMRLDALLRELGINPPPRRARDRSHEAQVEQLLRHLDRAVRERPLVIFIQDYADLGAEAKQAVNVLSRYLIARYEHARMRPSIPALLVVDVGADDTAPLCNPDSDAADAPIVPLAALDAEDAERLIATRFPGFSLERSERESLQERSGGLPRNVVALMAEGGRRGDFLPAEGSWTWRVHEVHKYPAIQPLDPLLEHAWDTLPEASREILQTLALAQGALPTSLLTSVFGSDAMAAVETSPLVATSCIQQEPAIVLAQRSVSELALSPAKASSARALAERFVTSISTTDQLPPLTHVRLQLRANLPTDAFATLAASIERFTQRDHAFAASLMQEAIDAAPSLLEDPHHHCDLIRLLPRSPQGVKLALQISEFLNPNISGPEVVLDLAKFLNRQQEFEQGLSVLSCWTLEDGCGRELSTRYHIERAKSFLSTERYNDASSALTLARQKIQGLKGRGRNLPIVLTSYLLQRGQLAYIRRRDDSALRCWSVGARYARRTGNAATLSRMLNNIGMVHARRKDYATTSKHFNRALRVKRAIGDINGIIRTSYNLALLDLEHGHVVRGVSSLLRTVDVSQRHGMEAGLFRSLYSLALAYDRQFNSALALMTMQRAQRAAESENNSRQLSAVTSIIAPLAASLGDVGTARSALTTSAVQARRQEHGDSRLLHDFTCSLAHLHLGNPDEARMHLERTRGNVGESTPQELRARISLLSAVLFGDMNHFGQAKLARELPTRHITRFAVWATRLHRRPDRQTPPPTTFEIAIPRTSVNGGDRRLFIEAIIACASAHPSGSQTRSNLQLMARNTQRSGERTLTSRILSLLTRATLADSKAHSAELWSRSVASCPADVSPIPIELRNSYFDLDPGDTRRSIHSTLSRESLEALAHRLMVSTQGATPQDTRVSHALRKVLQATAELRADHDLYRLLRTMTESVLEVTGAERACVVRVTEDGGQEICVASNSKSNETTSPSVVSLSQTVIDRVMKSRAPLLLHDVFDDSELMMRPSITKLSLRTILCVPMVRSDHLYGVLYADSTSTAASFDHIDLEVFTLFADHAAGALESQRLVANLQASMDELRRVQEHLIRGERLRTIGEISSGVAHEFNNLLTSILARVQLLSLTPMGSEMARDLELIETACMDAAEVVRRLQNFSRQECQAGFVVVDMQDVCRDSVDFLRPLWMQKNSLGGSHVSVNVIAPESVLLKGSPTELREVLTNLVKNSLDALENGGHIEVSLQQRGELALVAVKDDGPGIPSELQEKIFDPFFTTKGERGTGLGLYMCRQILERHGGKLELCTDRERGTEILLTVPVHDGSTERERAAQGSDEIAIHVLVVDDDENVRTPLARYLAQAGFRVTSAEGGTEGLELVPQSTPDVVISDVNMPGMDGLELCRQIKMHYPATPVVLRTGKGVDLPPNALRISGASALLEKPFAMRQVTELIGYVAGHSRSNEQ